LGTELHDLVTLLLHFFVQLEQLGPFRVGVLAVAYPRGPLRLDGAVCRLEAFVDLPCLELGPGERLGDVLQLDEPTLEVARRTRQLLELRFLGLARLERSEEHTSELQSRVELVFRLLREKQK